MYNPWDILEKVSCHLTKQGIVLISVPNLQNIKYIDAITSGNFLYDNTGLFDQTHIRFFTLKSLLGYLEQQNFKIISNGWRPDISIQNIKDNLIGCLISQNNVNLKLTSCELTINYENIELYFGQQILIAAKINE